MTMHAVDRAKRRLGLDLDASAIEAIRKEIDDGRAVLLVRPLEGGARYLVMHKGQAIRVIYDPETRALITVLPRGKSKR